MELQLGLHDVYFAVIGARVTSQGATKPQSFALMCSVDYFSTAH